MSFKNHWDTLQYNEFQKSLGHAFCNVASPPLPPFVNVDSMQIIKTSASQQKTEQTRQQQLSYQRIPKPAKDTVHMALGSTLTKWGEVGRHEAATTVEKKRKVSQ